VTVPNIRLKSVICKQQFPTRAVAGLAGGRLRAENRCNALTVDEQVARRQPRETYWYYRLRRLAGGID